MYRTVLWLAIVACVLPAGCGGGQKKTRTDGAEVELTAMQQLQAVSTDLQAGVDRLMAPINETQRIIDHITAMPGRLGIDAGSLMGMCKSSFQSGQLDFDANISAAAEVQAEVMGVLARLNHIVAELKATPQKVTALGQQAVEATAKVPLLATQVATSANVTLANPFSSAEDKAQAQADMNAVNQVKGEVMTKISEIQAKVTGIPAMATEALAKLGAAFAVG